MQAGGAAEAKPEFSGTLEGAGLPAVVRFVCGLKKTGCLRLRQDEWHAEIGFEAGQLTTASFGSRDGLDALDAVVQVMPDASFTFDTRSRPSSTPGIGLPADALQAHLDELSARVATGTPSLPSADVVPELVVQTETSVADDPLPLDRARLQTLLAVNGQRTVREIVAQRGSVDVLWQLAGLADVGLVRFTSPTSRTVRVPADAGRPGQLPSLDAVGFDTVGGEHASGEAAAPVVVQTPIRGPDEPSEATGHCPKLGFGDEPRSSFSRPTRLHRCFAAGTPLPLSLDQQRELCLSDHFSTCPRLSISAPDAARLPGREFGNPRTATGGAGNAAPAAAGRTDAVSNRSEADDPRVVRWPSPGRNKPLPRRGARDDGQPDADASSSSQPSSPPPSADSVASHSSPLLSPGLASVTGDAQPPTPLRVRINRPAASEAPAASGGSTASADPVAAAARAPASAPRESPTPRRRRTGMLLASPTLARLQGTPIAAVAAVSIGVAVVALAAFLLVPQLGRPLVDDTVDLSGLPNAGAVAAGSPVAQVVPRRTAVPASSQGASASAASAAGAPAEPSLLPEVASARATPTGPLGQAQPAQTAATGSPAAAVPTGGNAQPAAAATRFDENFSTNAHNWPSNPQGTAWLTGGSYRLIPRQAGQFVALGAPVADVPQDVVVSATFHKLSGTPPGGGFGIILRDQSPSSRDGTNQAGQYYVLEVGDKGEVGIWRRDTDHWVDLLAWQHADAVQVGTATNEMTASAIGNRLSLSVNGTTVVTRTDATLSTGGVGMLVGGDDNEVAVDRFSVQTP